MYTYKLVVIERFHMTPAESGGDKTSELLRSQATSCGG